MQRLRHCVTNTVEYDLAMHTSHLQSYNPDGLLQPVYVFAQQQNASEPALCGWHQAPDGCMRSIHHP